MSVLPELVLPSVLEGLQSTGSIENVLLYINIWPAKRRQVRMGNLASNRTLRNNYVVAATHLSNTSHCNSRLTVPLQIQVSILPKHVDEVTRLPALSVHSQDRMACFAKSSCNLPKSPPRFGVESPKCFCTRMAWRAVLGVRPQRLR